MGVAGFVCSLWGLHLLLPWNIGCFFLFTVSAHFPPATLYTLCALYTLYFPLSLSVPLYPLSSLLFLEFDVLRFLSSDWCNGSVPPPLCLHWWWWCGAVGAIDAICNLNASNECNFLCLCRCAIFECRRVLPLLLWRGCPVVFWYIAFDFEPAARKWIGCVWCVFVILLFSFFC